MRVLTVNAVDEVTDDLVRAVHRLLPQLSGSARLPSGAEIKQIVDGPATTLFVARLPLVADEATDVDRSSANGLATGAQGGDEDIVGMLTLAVFPLPTGTRAWVEDVVVDARARRQGAGDALVQAAVAWARSRGAQTLDLTSRPAREDANRLYQRLGFELRQTNVYRLKISPS